MQKLTSEDFGAPHVDAEPVNNPESEMGASDVDLMIETTSQGSFTSPASVGTFITSGTSPVAPANIAHSSHWGNADGTKPTIARTDTGRYTLTFPTSWTNGLGVIESISFFEGEAPARSADPDDDVYAEVLSISTNVVTVKTESPKGTLADVGDNSGNAFTVGWRLYR